MKTMKMMKMMRQGLKAGLWAPLALTCLFVAPHARADSILFGQATLVNGSLSTVDSFTAPIRGTVTVDLKALDWSLTAISSLSFSATSANPLQLLTSWSGIGMSSDTLTFDVGPGTYFAHIMATAGGPWDIGLYSVMMTFSPTTPPVPLPSSDWMLLTGMLALAGLVRVLRPFESMGAARA